MKLRLWTAALACGCVFLGPAASAKDHSHATGARTGVKAPKAPGTARIWEDRGDLTPAQVFWGSVSGTTGPDSRLPAPPFSNFVKDTTPNAYSPKCYVTDKNGVKWTVKFGSEVHADVAASRLAWALGYEADEGYYIPAGKIEGVTGSTDRGKATKYVKSDGTFQNARFKRHPEHHLTGPDGQDIIWDEAVNPGVPQQPLSGLKILDDMVFNWDAQAKNCKVLRVKGADGPEDWYIMSDWGESFGPPKSAWKLSSYQSCPFIMGVSNGTVTFRFSDAISKEARDHQRIPLADAQWFRARLEKLTDDDIRAAFNAAVADDAMAQAYTAGDPARVNSLTTPEVNGFVAAFRRRIEEFKTKVPAGP